MRCAERSAARTAPPPCGTKGPRGAHPHVLSTLLLGNRCTPVQYTTHEHISTRRPGALRLCTTYARLTLQLCLKAEACSSSVAVFSVDGSLALPKGPDVSGEWRCKNLTSEVHAGAADAASARCANRDARQTAPGAAHARGCETL